MMRYLACLFLCISFLWSCNSLQTDEKKIYEDESDISQVPKLEEVELIIGERIDGPANVRSKPNGDILFELFDNALVQVAAKPQNDWYGILVHADLDVSASSLDSISKGKVIIQNNDTIGRVLKSLDVSTVRGNSFAYAELFGFTHKNNIKSETVIELVFKTYLTGNGRNLSDWKGFIKSFKLKTDAIEYEQFQTYYNYENIIDDPSPGFRIVLLFENEQLIGLIHSRKIQIEKTKTHKLNWSYFVTFFEEYPETKQLKFVGYMNEWIMGVD